MIEKIKVTLILLVIVIFLILSAGCQTPVKPPSPENVRVGVLLPMTGELSDKGRDSSNGVILAIEEINAAGGIASLGGARLVPVMGDTQSRPDTGVNETVRLINDEGVTAIIGAYQSSVTKPATQAAERFKTPFISEMSIADVITERGFHYTFRICPKAGFYGRDQVHFLSYLGNLTGKKVQRVALIHENTDFGTSTALAQKEALKKYGMEMVSEVSYDAGKTTDLTNEVAQVLAAKPDAILEVTYLDDSILIRRALASAGSKIPLVDTAGGTVSPEYIQRLGPLSEGTLTVSEFSKYAGKGRELNDRFRARFGADITGDSAYSYQAVWVLKDALERAGSVDRQKVRDALAATDMQGPHMILPAERIRFDATGQNEFVSLFVVQIQNGELVPVWPAEFATAKVRMG